jgi:hypothetical protein
MPAANKAEIVLWGAEQVGKTCRRRWEMMGRYGTNALMPSGGHHGDHGGRTLLGQQGHRCPGRVLSCTLACQISSECVAILGVVSIWKAKSKQVPWFISTHSKVFQLLFWSILNFRDTCASNMVTLFFKKQCLDVPRWEPLAPARHGRDCLRPLQQAGVMLV